MEVNPVEVKQVVEVKLVLLGDAGVGKTSLVRRFVSNHFREFSESTIGASFLSKLLVVDEVAYKFQIWDTAGQEKYHGLAPMYYRNAAAAIVVYDITDMGSFDTLQAWVKELREKGPPDIVIAVVGNKCDLESQRQVDAQKAKQYADSIEGLFFESSAKEDTNVTDVFIQISKKLPRAAGSGGKGLQLDMAEEKPASKKVGCC